MSKGSRNRTDDFKAYRAGYERAFGRKTEQEGEMRHIETMPFEVLAKQFETDAIKANACKSQVTAASKAYEDCAQRLRAVVDKMRKLENDK